MNDYFLRIMMRQRERDILEAVGKTCLPPRHWVRTAHRDLFSEAADRRQQPPTAFTGIESARRKNAKPIRAWFGLTAWRRLKRKKGV